MTKPPKKPIKDIILIDQDPLRVKVWKLSLEKEGLNLFTPEDPLNPYYLLQDIDSYLLLFDVNTKPNKEFLKDITLPKNPLILLGLQKDLDDFDHSWQEYFPNHELLSKLYYPLVGVQLVKLIQPYL